MKREDIDPKYTKVEVSVKLIGHLLRSFEADFGSDELIKFLDKTGIPLKYFENENNWVSFEYLISILDKLVEYSGNPQITYKYGLNTIKYADSWGILKTIFTLMPSTLYMYKSAIKFSSRYSKAVENKITELKNNKVVIETSYKDGYLQTVNNCLNMKGIYASLPSYFGLPYAEIKELQCAAAGADSCAYEITWQKKPAEKNKFFSLLFTILGVYIIYALTQWFDTTNIFLSKILLFVLPVALYAVGHALDFKRTIKDNTEVIDDQNKVMIESLEDVQGLNEELQQKIDRRTEELKISNKILEKSLLDLRKSEDDLLEAEKMAGIGRLAAGVAHEINNPMGAVRNFLQDILEDITESDPRREALTEAEKATKESKIIINDLLSFSRTYENLYIVEIDVNEVIERICERIKLSNFNVKINKYLTPDIPAIKSDQMQVNQALNNIVLNACNASKENGVISIKTSATPEGIHVEITDNGEIIPRFLIDKLFDPFDKEYKWVGRKDLGLAISYSIIKRFDGDITVSSSIENGTIFNVLIPYVIKV